MRTHYAYHQEIYYHHYDVVTHAVTSVRTIQLLHGSACLICSCKLRMSIATQAPRVVPARQAQASQRTDLGEESSDGLLRRLKRQTLHVDGALVVESKHKQGGRRRSLAHNSDL